MSAIAISAEQQSAGLQQVNTAVGEMDSVTQQNAAMVEQSTAAARSLASEADQLGKHVARFRLGMEPRTTAPMSFSPQALRTSGATKVVATRPQTRGALALAIEPDQDDWSKF